MVSIRECTPHEIHVANGIVDTAVRQLRHVYRPTLEATLRQSQKVEAVRVFLASIDETCVGTASIFHNGDQLTMYRIAVKPEFHRCGVARALIDGIASICRQTGYEHDEYIVLQTIRETGNVRIFERLGFAVIDEQVAKWCISDTYVTLHEVTMRKRIA